MSIKYCIYCQQHKDSSEFTLEHIIPQFLGGAYSPDHLKTNNVCKKCNSNLGLFVDAGFEKNWLVSNYLRAAARSCFDQDNPVGLPLVCMGNAELSPPYLPNDYICELWLGVSGEQVYWLRPKDDRLYWYVGGNPRTTKKENTRAYFLFSKESQKNPIISWLSFRDSFEGRCIRKVMCNSVEGGNVEDIGFVQPDKLDKERIDYFKHFCFQNQSRSMNLKINTNIDYRFLAKIAVGISYCLFGHKVLETNYGNELYRALWYREGQNLPRIFVKRQLDTIPNESALSLVSFKHGVTVAVIPVDTRVIVNIDIGGNLNCSVQIASTENLNNEDLALVDKGVIFLLLKYLHKGFYYSLPEFLAHKTGDQEIPDLTKISQLFEKNEQYFKRE